MFKIAAVAAVICPGIFANWRTLSDGAIILTRATALEVPVSELRRASAAVPTSGPRESSERDEILRVLRETKESVGGPNGAAMRMGVSAPRSFPAGKKLGIDSRSVS